jgi:hypothetical protein
LLVWCLMWALRLRSLLATAPSKFPRMKSEAEEYKEAWLLRRGNITRWCLYFTK